MSVTIDPVTGLHAEDCDCIPCQTGYAPTPRERETALRSVMAAKLKAERAAKAAPPPKRPGWVSRYMPPVPDHRPYTPEQLADLDQLKRSFRR